MVTREITITLPDEIAQAAEKRGLLTPQSIQRLLDTELERQRSTEQLREMMERLTSLDEPPLTIEELNDEIKAVRAERKAKPASRP